MAEPILRAQRIVKEYALGRTRLRVLRGVDLDIAEGEFIAIVGASGSGKSTLLHVLGALDVPQQGQVWYRGEPLFEPEALRQTDARGEASGAPAAGGHTGGFEAFRNALRNAAFGFVFQFYYLLPEFDVVENVMLPAIVGSGAAAWSARRANLRARAERLLREVDLGHRLAHRPNELSGGERQRVAIARALMNEPAVLLADEPTGNLDTQTGREVLDRLVHLNRAGQTIVMVTHDAEIAARADRIVRLVDGRAA